eukprot:TRINITY_DN43119_c0_g1_i1.p1 TRINITY_DN43119_c0_g1~~TRINITY_DN43119_c0_g1_i1.p1  ORF type:complete len:288 (-),score=54.91 TRINITY_DN43119_c0_g1_i1:237-1019(-)
MESVVASDEQLDGASGLGATLQLKHHIINGRLAQAKRLIETSRLALEEVADEDGHTPLHWCAQGLEAPTDKREATDEEVLAFLLQHDAPRNRQNVVGETPLFTAVRLSSREPQRAERLVAELLRKGSVNPCRADVVGETPLMEAMSLGSESLGRLLLEFRADPLAVSKTGLTAAKLAENEACTGLLKLPLAERAAREPCTGSFESTEGAEDKHAQDFSQKRKIKNFDETLFGQMLRPGLAKDKDRPGKPYPEYGTLHDID